MKLDTVTLIFIVVEVALISVLLSSISQSSVLNYQPHGVIEYFIYRYQTLAAGAAAIVAALIAVRPVYRQLNEMNRQSAAATVPIFRAIAYEIEEEITQVEEANFHVQSLKNLIRDYHDNGAEAVYEYWQGKVYENLKMIDKSKVHIENKMERSGTYNVSRRLIIGILSRLISKAHENLYALHTDLGRIDYEIGQEEYTREEYHEVKKKIWVTLKTWTKIHHKHVEFLNKRRRDAWDEVRKVERQAGAVNILR